jgi:hypothetical protein
MITSLTRHSLGQRIRMDRVIRMESLGSSREFGSIQVPSFVKWLVWQKLKISHFFPYR